MERTYGVCWGSTFWDDPKRVRCPDCRTITVEEYCRLVLEECEQAISEAVATLRWKLGDNGE